MASRRYIENQAADALRLQLTNVLIVLQNESRWRGKIIRLNEHLITLRVGDREIPMPVDEIANVSFSIDPMPYGCNVPVPQ